MTTRRERALRKELLLIKGDALRVQLGMEIALMQRRLSLAGTIARTIAALRGTLGLFGPKSGKRGWLRKLLQGWSIARTAIDLFKRF